MGKDKNMSMIETLKNCTPAERKQYLNQMSPDRRKRLMRMVGEVDMSKSDERKVAEEYLTVGDMKAIREEIEKKGTYRKVGRGRQTHWRPQRIQMQRVRRKKRPGKAPRRLPTGQRKRRSMTTGKKKSAGFRGFKGRRL